VTALALYGLARERLPALVPRDTLGHVTIVSGDFVKTGGMDRANYALADYLSRHAHSLELVAHRADPELIARNGVEFRRVRKPFGSYLLGEPLLDIAGRRAARSTAERHGTTVVNGGNCIAGTVNWVHYLHAVYRTPPGARLRSARAWVHGISARRRERVAMHLARVVITNSAATRRAVIDHAGVPPERAFVVYYGMDAARFAPTSAEEAAENRRKLGWPERPCLAFVGALGDRRKGFDTLYAAFRELAREPSWDADLVAVGAGAEVEGFRARALRDGLAGRVRLLGFRKDVPVILGACDALVAPARYEAFGLGVAEALARGLPAIVSAHAGVAELYSSDLADLLLEDPDSVHELVRSLRRWREALVEQRARVESLSNTLRARSWDTMAAEIVEIIERNAG
jgi:glycosyltransferase involved in cell wall biosynthesis